jgi:hypothetical protein
VVSDQEKLLRMIWNPRDFDRNTKQLKANAFSKADLIPSPDELGQPRYVSMDRAELVVQASVDWRIARAKALGKGAKEERRIEARFLEFSCLQLRQLRLLIGLPAFEVFEAPVVSGEDGPDSPANEAHAGVRSTTPDPEDDALREEKLGELRNLLLSLHQPQVKAQSYLEVFSEADPSSQSEA